MRTPLLALAALGALLLAPVAQAAHVQELPGPLRHYHPPDPGPFTGPLLEDAQATLAAAQRELWSAGAGVVLAIGIAQALIDGTRDLLDDVAEAADGEVRGCPAAHGAPQLRIPRALGDVQAPRPEVAKPDVPDVNATWYLLDAEAGCRIAQLGIHM